MSSANEKKTRSLIDYADLLALLASYGVPHVVIGGCAVGVYAHEVGESVLSGDLDLYATPKGTRAIVGRSIADGADVFRRPRPRSVQVTMFHWRELEVNVISASAGLKDPETEMQLARELPLPGHPGVSVLVADPFQLLTNKLSVNRAKDRPHIAVLRRFLEEEIVYSFEHASSPRERIVPAQRYLRINRQRVFDERIARRLLPLARNPPELRFLVDCAPSAALADAVIEQAEDVALRQELVAIRKKRRFR